LSRIDQKRQKTDNETLHDDFSVAFDGSQMKGITSVRLYCTLHNKVQTQAHKPSRQITVNATAFSLIWFQEKKTFDWVVFAMRRLVKRSCGFLNSATPLKLSVTE